MRAWRIGKDAGPLYVYCGNLPAIHEDTMCYACNQALIRRACYYVVTNRLEQGRCPSCHKTIRGVWYSGQVVLQLKSPYKDGTTHVVMEPLELNAWRPWCRGRVCI
jgi:hypothetical protein